jgi:class 3 adenylate cyclase
MAPAQLVDELDKCFSYFDNLMDRYNLEKLKTIGDSYMFAGGVPVENPTHAIDCVMAALEIQSFMSQMREIKSSQNLPYWQLRLGIHSGELVAGVIGEKKFQYDVWSDTVNTASRCESSGLPEKINISESTYNLVKDFFSCEFRGPVKAKNKGEINMYLVTGLRPELHRPGEARIPNEEFKQRYNALRQREAA